VTTMGLEDRSLTRHQAGNYREHTATAGPLPRLGSTELRRLALDSGLTGRGGAGFPIGRKVAAVAAGSGRRRAVVIANGAEGEPASSKDRVLLAIAPHLVLDGLALAAMAVRAGECYLYAPPDVLLHVQEAIRQRGDLPAIGLVASPDLFIAGQESAAVAAVEGRAALPSHTPPAVFQRGVRGRPTLVQNIETLAHLGLIARYGAEWFRSIGLPMDPGTRLLTLSGAVAQPGVYEMPTGRTLGSIVESAGGVSEPVQALLIGGYHGGWLPWNGQTSALPLARQELAVYGASPGAGVVIALASTRCGLQATADIATYLAGQTAGQCGPCRNGLPALAGHLHTLAYGRPRASTRAEITRVCAIVEGRGACHHPNGTIRMIASGMRTFTEEVHRHLEGSCSAHAPKWST
jgi:NADH:ubiquinone oxidoreductase subunit F (NADH-binding)